jgi:LacI family transcriptional regulator
MGKVTIEDISRHTGLSRGTVSRALNDRPDISSQTKQRVLEACMRLKYVPSHAARSLATGRRYAVAVLVDDLRSMFAASFLRGVISRARTERYAVHVSELGTEPERAVEHLRTLVNERVDSLLFATALRADLAYQFADMINEHPLVTASAVPGLAADIVAPDYAEGGRLAAGHVLRGGAADILYVYENGSESATLRRTGFQEACRAAGGNPDAATIEVPTRTAAQAERLAPVRDRLGSIRAIVAGDDLLAIDLMLLCCQMGRVPGRDIAVIGQGNELVGARISPGLTTIDFCGEEVGQRAMDLSLQRVAKARQDAPLQTYVPPQLVTRESTHLAQ